MRSSLTHFLSRSERLSSALSRLTNSSLSPHVHVAPEIRNALNQGLPIVSLESAITSHGLPPEQAISVAKSLDTIIRAKGVVPAAIGLIDGIIKIGLEDREIQRLAESKSRENDNRKWKIGRRDIASAILKKVDGGTTVSATSFLSHLVGIETFVTGSAQQHAL